MEKFDAWAVAAAVLASGDEFERELHYRTLAERVLATNMTTLGQKGATPAQTLGVILREHKDIFASYDRGYYYLENPERTGKHPVVARAIQALQNLQEEQLKAGELESLRREVQRLKERNALLERRLAEIAEICGNASKA